GEHLRHRPDLVNAVPVRRLALPLAEAEDVLVVFVKNADHNGSVLPVFDNLARRFFDDGLPVLGLGRDGEDRDEEQESHAVFRRTGFQTCPIGSRRTGWETCPTRPYLAFMSGVGTPAQAPGNSPRGMVRGAVSSRTIRPATNARQANALAYRQTIPTDAGTYSSHTHTPSSSTH